MSDELNLGTCCGCGKTGSDVRNMVALPFSAPKANTGWGCFICKLPANGAVSVVCDDCLESERMDFVCVGYPEENERMPMREFRKAAKPFDHDMSKH